VSTPAAPTWPSVLARWSFEAPVVALLILAALGYTLGRRELGSGPDGRRPAAFGAGLAVLAVALLSPVATYGHALLSVHMVQHLLLVLVAAPLLVAAHPVPALLAVLPDGLASRLRALGRSGPARAVTHPLVAWLAFAAVGWGVHFSPLFDAALAHPLVHAAEHALFLVSGLLFWAPVLGRGALSHPLRLLYVALAMPQNTFLALAILSAGHPLYDGYVRLGRTWGPSVLDDQRQGAGLMWVAGDLTLLVAVLAVAAVWAGHERDDDDEDEEDEPLAPVSGAGRAGRPPSPRTTA
jgi:cytochrome c oxidase assembly factor CtaG